MTGLVSVARRAVAVRHVIPSGCTTPATAAAVGREASSTLGALVCCPRRSLSTASPRGPRRAEGSRRSCWLPSSGREVAAQLAGASSSRRSSSSSSSESGGLAKPLLKPMRSVLYTPGSSRHLYKIREIACDASLIDLEDGVAPEAKDNARERVCSEVAKGGYGRKAVVVRINSLDSPWGEDDIREVAKLTVDAVVIPKVESAADVKRVADLLRHHGAKDTDLWCMIETPLGVTRANEIASAHETVSCLVLGTSDLTRDLQANHTPDRTPLLYSLSCCILAARTYGLRCLDGVHLDMTDAEGFERACRQGRDMGMDGKTLIHPSTVAVANWFFGPNASEVEQAYRVVEAHEEAAARGEGCAVLDGSLVERLHAENARRIIELHESIAALEAGHEAGT
ncbi:unnamed protein product [Ectocarpus fasciculatus]